MDRFFETQQDIAAPAQRIWDILTDAARLDAGFGILRLDGVIAPGQRLKLWSEVAPKRAFPLRVVEFTPPERMVWQGGMPLGLFTGLRSFSVIPISAQHSRFVMREDYSGVLAAMIFPKLPDLTPSFQKFAKALQHEAER